MKYILIGGFNLKKLLRQSKITLMKPKKALVFAPFDRYVR